jgi:hypothetical protein
VQANQRKRVILQKVQFQVADGVKCKLWEKSDTSLPVEGILVCNFLFVIFKSVVVQYFILLLFIVLLLILATTVDRSAG